MLKHALIFLSTFALAAVVTLAVRARMHDPHASAPSPAASLAQEGSMNPARTAEAAPAPAAPDNSANKPAATPAATEAPVNTVCVICGMDVDPSIPPARYKDHLVGFGCRACPALFEANPDRYGPAALENKVIGR